MKKSELLSQFSTSVASESLGFQSDCRSNMWKIQNIRMACAQSSPNLILLVHLSPRTAGYKNAPTLENILWKSVGVLDHQKTYALRDFAELW